MMAFMGLSLEENHLLGIVQTCMQETLLRVKLAQGDAGLHLHLLRGLAASRTLSCLLQMLEVVKTPGATLARTNSAMISKQAQW